MLIRFLRKLQLLIWRRRFHRELSAEMAFHRQQAEQEFRASGMFAEQAHRAARRQFGNDLRLQEQCQDVVVFHLETMLQDLRFALRQLRKNPGFAATAILVLALGMAASVTIFAFVDAALLQPLPYQNPSRLVAAYETTNSCRECEFSYPDYLDWNKANTVFSSLEAWEANVHLWRSPEGVQAVRSAYVGAGFFRTLGVAAMLGRSLPTRTTPPPRHALLCLRTTPGRAVLAGDKTLSGRR